MTLFVCWVVFPLVLGLLCLGGGLFVEQLAGVRLPGPLLLPVGLATLIVVASFATTNAATAKLATPAVVALAVAGLGLAAPWSGRRFGGGALVAAVGVFAVYAAPIVLSGKATFAGYITLDDTSTWLAMTDRVMDHGRSLAGLQPSSYEAVLDAYLKQSGYPVGAFLPLGLGGKLMRQDIAWLFQPYIAYAAAMLALSLYTLLRRLVRSQWWWALAAFIAAQPALLYGYAMWSGIKEVTAAVLIALFAALLPSALLSKGALEDRSPRRLLPLAIAVAAALAALSVGGLAWLFAALVFAAAGAIRIDARAFAGKAVALSALVAALSAPAILVAAAFIRHETSTSSLTGASEIGNLLHPLNKLQILGIWPAGDFRVDPKDLDLTYILVAVVALAAATGLVLAWRSRAWELLLYVGTVAIGAALLIAKGSPWVDGKALATASAAFPLAGMAACGFVFERGRRVEAVVVAAAIAGGVLWSNVLAYHDVWLAPRSQLVELESIGKKFAGEGPTLMTEYQPYGDRHFLRRVDPEGAGELRRRLIPLLNGEGLGKSEYADLDQFQLGGILVYKTIVLRRSPAESRPPSSYQLVWRGRFYEVWQRPSTYAPILQHLPLGNATEPGGVPQCSDVEHLASVAGPSGRLVAVRRAPAIVVNLSTAQRPGDWQADQGGNLFPRGAGTVETDVAVPRTASYSFWLGGSFRDGLRLLVDGREVSAVRDQLNSVGQYTPLGASSLTAGRHRVVLEYSGTDLRPGSAGSQFGIGPLVVSRGSDDARIVSVPPARARTLCNENLDWVEALGSSF
jgi:hypothetical protein